jgi:hypothetical protein
MDDDATDADGIGRMGDAQGAVAKQRPAEAPALLRTVDRQAAEHRVVESVFEQRRSARRP